MLLTIGMKRPNDQTPDPPGGRAAERLRDFTNRRRPGGVTPADESTKPPAQPQDNCPDPKKTPAK